MSNRIYAKRRRNPFWLVKFFRRIGYARYYKRNGMSWLEAWDVAGRVLP